MLRLNERDMYARILALSDLATALKDKDLEPDPNMVEGCEMVAAFRVTDLWPSMTSKENRKVKGELVQRELRFARRGLKTDSGGN